jgi:hypothetical protein
MTRSLARFARHLALPAAIAVTLIRLGSGSTAWAGDLDRHESWSWNGVLEHGHTLEVNGINGSIVAVPGTGDRVEVVADKHGRRHDPTLVSIEVHQEHGDITICANYPGKSTPCRAAGFTFRDHADDVQVDFTVKVPAGAYFRASNVNGAVRAHGLDGPVKLETVNGACDLETRGQGEATTVNGAVHATVGRLGSGDQARFKTVNGAITLRLPADTNAEVSASTVNGGIHTDFPITVSGGFGPRHLHGTLGKGGGQLTLSTVNGAISLERMGTQ